MKPVTLLILVTGFILGWFGHALFSPQSEQQIQRKSFFDVSVLGTTPETKTYNSPNAANDTNIDQIDTLTAQHISPQDLPKQPRETSAASVPPDIIEKTLQEKLHEFLAAEHYLAAMGIFQEAEKISRDKVAKLKEILKTHLKTLLSSKRESAFTELSDRYLAMYYDDTDILLLLAEFNSNSNFYIDALSMYQLANEYAYTFEQKQGVREHYRTFMSSVHRQLASQNDWYQLNQIYAQANILGLLDNQDKLKQAEVHIALGDHHLARQTLNSLVNQNHFVSEARALLATLDGSNRVTEASASDFAKQIALSKIGNQFTVPLVLGRYATATTLLIDTGASLTTLSRQTFERYEHDLVFRELGSRMFNTANGLAKGRVVQLDTIELGGFKLENALIAVLDFDTHNGIEGLLGMNVLGRFKFQIDQQNSLLSLTPQHQD